MAEELRFGSAYVWSVTDAEVADVLADNPINGYVVYNSDRRVFQRFDEATVSFVDMEGAEYAAGFKLQEDGLTGATYTNALLIGAELLSVMLNGFGMWIQAGTGTPPDQRINFDDTTGTIYFPMDLTGSWIHVLYKALTPTTTTPPIV